MCGRFIISMDPEDFKLKYEVSDFPKDFTPRYNVAPSQPIAVIRDTVTRHAEWMRWGLVPSWAKDITVGSRMINARAETLLEKPSFLNAFQKRRCLIPANGFYEWQKRGRNIVPLPYLITLKDKSPFAFAGLWDSWTPPGGQPIQTCTIVTCSPNELIASIHDRMPVILDPINAWLWMSPQPTLKLQSLLKPYPAEQMEMVACDPRLNNAEIDSPELANPDKPLQ